MTRVLFLVKKREMTYSEDEILQKNILPNFKYCVSSGLRNSATFIVEMLNYHGIHSKLSEVVDNNSIDAEVSRYKPTHCIIEAFWVVPDKFDILQKLHPNVTWIIRNHSEMPFLANDFMASDWMLEYLSKDNVVLAPNSLRAYNDTLKMAATVYGKDVADEKVWYLPNYYKVKKNYNAHTHRPHHRDAFLDIGCFGAIRPLKNHFIQSIAAVEFAERRNQKLRFHINVARIEDAGNSCLNSIRGFFKHLDPSRFQLVEHGWLDHDDFLKLVKTMDLGMQVSFTESFNIVAADFVSCGIPIVVSKEISWMPKSYWASETNVDHIVDVMGEVHPNYFRDDALFALEEFNKYAIEEWLYCLNS